MPIYEVWSEESEELVLKAIFLNKEKAIAFVNEIADEWNEEYFIINSFTADKIDEEN